MSFYLFYLFNETLCVHSLLLTSVYHLKHVFTDSVSSQSHNLMTFTIINYSSDK